MKSNPKIVPGGQTGADRAGLDWALAHNVECGGWCPNGRKAEDGPIDAKYPLKETTNAQNKAQKSQSKRNRFASREPVARRKRGSTDCRPLTAYRTPSRLVWPGLSPPYTP